MKKIDEMKKVATFAAEFIVMLGGAGVIFSPLSPSGVDKLFCV